MTNPTITKMYKNGNEVNVGVARGTTAPQNPEEGMLWYDTTNDVLKTYDGSQWNEAGGSSGATFTGGTMVDAGDTEDYSPMQGPCSDGFHVPTKTEMTALLTATTTLGIATAGGYMNYLKIPNSLHRDWEGPQDKYGPVYIRCCTQASQYGRADCLNMNGSSSSNVISIGVAEKSNGGTVRAFKDIPVQPDSGWTTLYDGSSVATGAGVFHNATKGIISISADGINWITISDKNEGATTVYNNGDTLSESNAGKYYQWGNNYGFPYSGSVTTSTTRVDLRGYGPGNYYSSSTFIYNYAEYSSYAIPNMWGGAGGAIPAGMRFKVLSCPNQLKGISLSETYFGPGSVDFNSPVSISGMVAVEVHAAKVAAINGCNGPATTRNQCGNIYSFYTTQFTLRGGYASLKLTSSTGVVRYLCWKIHGDD